MPKLLNSTSCLTCRERKLRCDESLPICLNCQRKHRSCRHLPKIRWAANTTQNGKIVDHRSQVNELNKIAWPEEQWSDPPQSIARLLPRRALQNPIIASLFALYATTLAPWYDINDPKLNFATVVPSRALDNPILFKSLVAFSASYQSKFAHDDMYSRLSLDFHGELIKDLINVLTMPIPEVNKSELLAATCLLRSYEILNGDSRSRQDHLFGAYSLAVEGSIDLRPLDLLQAGFWNYLREDISTALECRRQLHIDMTKAPVLAFPANDSVGHDGWYANAISYLLAKIINLVFGRRTPSFSNQIGRLNSEVSHWKDILPQSFEAISTAAVRLVFVPLINADLTTPLPVAGLQYYHIAMILIRMASAPLNHANAGVLKRCDYHAQQICGIAVTNSSTPAWVVAFGPIAFCGRYLQDEIQQREVVKRLYQFSSDTGFNVQHIVSDLEQSWRSSCGFGRTSPG